jgi:hypothetical protein
MTIGGAPAFGQRSANARHLLLLERAVLAQTGDMAFLVLEEQARDAASDRLPMTLLVRLPKGPA